MELSTFATITGIFILLLALPLLVKSEKTYAFVQEYMRNSLHLRCTGAVIVVLSALTLKEGAAIGTDATGLIRIVAWIGLIKGLTAAWHPAVLTRLSQRILADAGVRPALAIVAMTIGGFLLYGARLV